MSASSAAEHEESVSNSLLLDDLSPAKRLKELKTLPRAKENPSGGGPPAAILAAQQASIAAGLVPSATNTNSGGSSAGVAYIPAAALKRFADALESDSTSTRFLQVNRDRVQSFVNRQPGPAAYKTDYPATSGANANANASAVGGTAPPTATVTGTTRPSTSTAGAFDKTPPNTAALPAHGASSAHHHRHRKVHVPGIFDYTAALDPHTPVDPSSTAASFLHLQTLPEFNNALGPRSRFGEGDGSFFDRWLNADTLSSRQAVDRHGLPVMQFSVNEVHSGFKRHLLDHRNGSSHATAAALSASLDSASGAGGGGAKYYANLALAPSSSASSGGGGGGGGGGGKHILPYAERRRQRHELEQQTSERLLRSLSPTQTETYFGPAARAQFFEYYRYLSRRRQNEQLAPTTAVAVRATQATTAVRHVSPTQPTTSPKSPRAAAAASSATAAAEAAALKRQLFPVDEPLPPLRHTSPTTARSTLSRDTGGGGGVGVDDDDGDDNATLSSVLDSPRVRFPNGGEPRYATDDDNAEAEAAASPHRGHRSPVAAAIRRAGSQSVGFDDRKLKFASAAASSPDGKAPPGHHDAAATATATATAPTTAQPPKPKFARKVHVTQTTQTTQNQQTPNPQTQAAASGAFGKTGGATATTAARHGGGHGGAVSPAKPSAASSSLSPTVSPALTTSSAKLQKLTLMAAINRQLSASFDRGANAAPLVALDALDALDGDEHRRSLSRSRSRSVSPVSPSLSPAASPSRHRSAAAAAEAVLAPPADDAYAQLRVRNRLNDTDDAAAAAGVGVAVGGVSTATATDGDTGDTDDASGSVLDPAQARVLHDLFAFHDARSSAAAASAPRPTSARTRFLKGCVRYHVAPNAAYLLRPTLTTTLSLSARAMGDDTALILAESLCLLPALEALELADNALTEKSLWSLLRHVAYAAHVTRVELCGNRLGRAMGRLALLDYLAAFSPDDTDGDTGDGDRDTADGTHRDTAAGTHRDTAATATHRRGPSCRLQTLRVSRMGLDDAFLSLAVEALAYGAWHRHHHRHRPLRHSGATPAKGQGATQAAPSVSPLPPSGAAVRAALASWLTLPPELQLLRHGAGGGGGGKASSTTTTKAA
eukprot:gene16948-12129_t